MEQRHKRAFTDLDILKKSHELSQIEHTVDTKKNLYLASVFFNTICNPPITHTLL